jgi:hypothetical protein
MAIYYPPPNPFVGGRQPLAPKDLNPSFEEVQADNPIPRQVAVFTAILMAWQPAYLPYVPQQRQIQIPQEFVETEHIPPSSKINVILNSWNQNVPTIQVNVKVPIVEEVTDNPPFSSRTILPVLITSWITPDPIIQKQNKFIFEEAVVSEVIPFTSRINIILSNWQERTSLIQIGSKLTTEGVAVAETVPYARPQLYIYLEDYYPLLPKKFNPEVFVPPAVVDDPPFGRKVLWFNTVLDAWIPPPPPPWNPIVHITPPPSDDIIIWMWKRVL